MRQHVAVRQHPPDGTGLAPRLARLLRLEATRGDGARGDASGGVADRIVIAWGDDTVRGGQTVFHGIRMWSQLLRVGLVLVAALTVGVPGAQLWRNHSGYDAYAAAMLTMAEAKLALGYSRDSGQQVRLGNGDTAVATIADIAAHAPWRALRRAMLDTIHSGAWLGVRIGGGIVLAMLVWFRWRGGRLKRRRRLRGAELVTARRLRRRIGRDRAPYRVAGVPYPARAETQHTMVTGTTGTGKTVLISDLVRQIRDRGERCVVYDKMGSYTEAFFDPARDVLLNPLDARAPRWSPFFEARNLRDFDTMAAALIPQQKDTVDPFWVTAARQLYAHGAGTLWQKGETRNRVLVDQLLKTDLTDLAKAMEGTVAQSIVDPQNPKTALSVRAMLTSNIGALEVLPDTGGPFSIRDWIAGEQDDSFLFLTSRGDQHASLRGLISTWLEIAVNSLLSLDRDGGRRVWVILDELPTLHQVPSLQPGLAESRQFGGCFVLGVQVASALRDLYGKNGAETLSGLCGTRVVFAAPDRDTAQWSADSLGRSEVEEFAEGVSYGADPYRDGVTLTPKRELQALALPSEIMRLPNLTGYLKLPGPYPVARFRLKYVKRPVVAPRFVPGGEHAPPRIPEREETGRSEAEQAPRAARTPPDSGSAAEDGAGATPATEAAATEETPTDAPGEDAGGNPPAVDRAPAVDGSPADGAPPRPRSGNERDASVENAKPGGKSPRGGASTRPGGDGLIPV